jgi:peptidoglycan/LPS O-acetylase OafA/YrhL
VTYTTNIANMFTGSTPDPGLNHLWSLTVEEQFYLLWPPVLYALLRWSVRPRGLVTGLVALAVLTIAATPWFAHVDSILVGCLAGVLFTFRLVLIPRWLAWGGVGAAVLMTGLAYDTAHTEPWPLPVFPLAAGLVMLGAVDRDWIVASVLSFRPLRYVGRISYGLYLWHVPLFVLLGWRIGLPLALIFAALSYRYVETPFLRRKQSRFQPPRVGAQPSPQSGERPVLVAAS